MATPLSGSLLHLEVASRGLKKDAPPDVPAALESLRIAQEELLRGSAWLDRLTEACAEPGREPVEFPLADAVRRGAEGLAEEAGRHGLGLELPPASRNPVLFGLPELLEQAVAELTRTAVGLSAGKGVLRWTVASAGEASEALCVAPTEAKEENLERALLREAGPMLARWAVEAHGGGLKLERRGSEFRAVLSFPETA